MAKALGGQIVNGDSMQVYRGADVLTNKVTKEEMQGIPHHLLGFVHPATAYNVSSFEKDAVEVVPRRF